MEWWQIVLIPVGLIVLTYVALIFVSENIRPWKIAGKGYLITGGSSGIGLATAKEFVEQGAHTVTIVARRQNVLDEAVAELQSIAKVSNPTCKIISISADVADETAMNNGVQSILSQGGRVDCLVASAGCSNPEYFENLSVAEFERTMRINFIGSVVCCKAVMPHFKSQKLGRIVLVGSMAGLVGVHGYTAYSPSKFAVRGFAESLYMEVKPYNIQVSLCNPPDVDTPMFELENISKPEECRKISESAGLFSAKQVADSIVGGIKHYKFMISTGFDGYVISLLTAGMCPTPNAGRAMIEIASASILRLVGIVLGSGYHSIVQTVYNEKNKEVSKDLKSE